MAGTRVYTAPRALNLGHGTDIIALISEFQCIKYHKPAFHPIVLEFALEDTRAKASQAGNIVTTATKIIALIIAERLSVRLLIPLRMSFCVGMFVCTQHLRLLISSIIISLQAFNSCSLLYNLYNHVDISFMPIYM